MNGYSAREIFQPAELDLLGRVQLAVDLLGSDFDKIRCHELARAVGKFFKLDIVDGYYGIVEHSWCLTPNGHILDPYCVGGMPQVKLVAPVPGCHDLYRTIQERFPDNERYRSDINEEHIAAALLTFTRGVR